MGRVLWPDPLRDLRLRLTREAFDEGIAAGSIHEVDAAQALEELRFASELICHGFCPTCHSPSLARSRDGRQAAPVNPAFGAIVWYRYRCDRGHAFDRAECPSVVEGS